jgi:hypothetical protein
MPELLNIARGKMEYRWGTSVTFVASGALEEFA